MSKSPYPDPQDILAFLAETEKLLDHLTEVLGKMKHTTQRYQEEIELDYERMQEDAAQLAFDHEKDLEEYNKTLREDWQMYHNPESTF